VRELNSKASQITKEGSLLDSFPGLFVDMEWSKPEPNQDIFFDDFVDLNFTEYKDVHIHALSLFDNGEYLNGLELTYLVDGDLTKTALHFRLKRSVIKGKGAGLAFLMGKKPTEETKLPSDLELGIRQTSLYFKRNEYIRRVKVSGDTYLYYIEIETNSNHVYRVGNRRADDHDCDFEVEAGYKIIAFSGVVQVMLNDSKMLNLSITSKQLQEDCESSAEIAPTYKEVIGKRYEMFNPLRTDAWKEIRRIKTVKLYPGKVIGKEKELNPKHFVLGGIKVTYELKNGDEFEVGIDSLRCTNFETEPAVLDLRDNEFITAINGNGKEYI